MQYFKHRFPHDLAVGTLVGDMPSAESAWTGEKYVLEKVGYKVVYDPTYAVTQTDFTQNVIAMKNAGVNILFVDQLPVEYAPSLLKALQAAGLPPGRGPRRGHLQQRPRLLLGRRGQRQRGLPRPELLALPRHRLQRHPVGEHLPQVGQHRLTRLQARPVHHVRVDLGPAVRPGAAERRLRPQPGVPARRRCPRSPPSTPATSIAANNPAAKTVGNCYLLGQVVNGQFQRLDDPPVSGSTNGYRCDYGYVTPPSGT